ncbi:putative phage protein [Apilactobacillus kunkeei EFB6]|uniref:Putative phage protein n=1 Tax=Apilactobacillus kunkeei EFB6 TaxID=1419324 RepID=A0A836YUJ9_9LACO|nr:Rha family transcriptional regulator [Apilactobacillus kunkeei]KDB00571.1 putative phage protein [Apilactobacillus kunkeei EFB6]
MYDLLDTGLVFTNSRKETEEPFTTNVVVAKYAGISYRAVNQLINRYKDEITSLGVSSFKMTKLKVNSTGRPVEVYPLNEQQASFLITLLKNTEKVVQFKYKLTKAFFETSKDLQKRKLEHAQSKVITKSLGDAIKDNPMTNSSHDYSNFNKLIYKHALGLNTNQLRINRGIPKEANIIDYLSLEEQQKVTNIKNVVISLLNMNLDYQTVKKTLSGIEITLNDKKGYKKSPLLCRVMD